MKEMSKTSEQTITITKTDFMKAMNEVNEELVNRHPAFPLLVSAVSILLMTKLFPNENDDLKIVKENES